ncbi:MAG: prephenate dehydrogenase/arogenate dehydrogenase family protein [Burkholderiaceae bacterium]
MKLALIGVGLIGGSFARAALAVGEVSEVSGFDAEPMALKRALALGAITEAAASAQAAVEQADLVMLAVPVGAMHGVMRAIAPHLRADAVVTDVGSTKADVLAAARGELGSAFARFVPGHPIAGRETHGVQFSDPGLFEGKLLIATPVDETAESAVARVERLWQRAGCRVERMEAGEHDRVFAAVSHLPHLLAFALVAQIAREDDAQRKLAKAGAGFRDFTRIAASSPAMWRDICIANREALSVELARYRALLEELQFAIDAGDAAALEAVFSTAAECRRSHAPRLDAE